jgi:ABC-type nitrate/sulfonate/bicarbonate transport system substrate-binding protein
MRCSLTTLPITASLLLVVALATGVTTAADPTRLRVKVFPGAQNLMIYTGLARGIFARHGLKVELLFTRNSQEQRDGLAKGDFEIAHAAVDNAVAMVEMTGADVVIVMGGDNSQNQLIVQPDIGRVEDLKGKTTIVDAPNTAYAVQLKKILLLRGLKPGQDYTVTPIGGTHLRLAAMREHKEYAASMMNPPFSIQAERAGFKSLGWAVDFIGPYQAGGAFVMRPWARAHRAELERYLAAYVESLRVAMAPANKDASIAILTEQLKLPPDVAARTWELMVDAKNGLATDARFDVEGFKNVLALRAEIEGQWGGQPPAAEKYYDLTYYDRALKSLAR